MINLVNQISREFTGIKDEAVLISMLRKKMIPVPSRAI